MKKLISSCSTFIAIIIIANYVAASSYKMKIKSNTQETKKGETITINVELTDYKDIKNGLQAYQGQIEYDTNIFEKIEPDQIELKNGWTSLQYNEENNAFVAIHKTGSLENEIISISLKVRENAKVGETTIKVKGFVASEGKEDINTDESETKINIVEKNNPTPPADENDNNNNSDKNNNNDNNGKNDNNNGNNDNENNVGNEDNINQDDNNISGNDNKNDNSKNETNNNKEEILPSKLPKTGIGIGPIQFSIIISILIIIAYYCYAKNKKLSKKEINKQIKKISVFVIGIISISTITQVYATLIEKGELNGDGKVSYDDITLLERHLIKLEMLPEDKQPNADMNGDKYLTVTDLALMVKKVEKTLEYTAEIKDIQIENNTPKKNEDIIIKFFGRVDYDEKIKNVTINGQEYEVEYIEGTDGEYTTKINSGDIAGIKKINFTSVTLQNDKKIKVNNTAKVDVLKDVPTVETFNAVEDEDGTKYKVTFELIDADDALISAEIVIEDEKGKELKRQEIQKGTNEVKFDLTKSTKYIAKVMANYELDTHTIETDKNIYENKEIFKQEINITDTLLEMKDIQSIQLYKQTDSKVEEVVDINTSDLENLNNYFVKVNMKDLPTLTTKISKYLVEDDTLKFVLNYGNVVQYEGDTKRNQLIVPFGTVKNNVASANSFSLLIDKIKQNPAGDYELTSDVDVNSFTIKDDYIFTNEFTGTLNGNGHIIKNITKPLFNTLNNAKIQNLVIENVALNGSNMTGTIANEAINVQIKNVHIKTLNLVTKVNQTGSLIGVIKNNSIIEECSASDINIAGGNKRIGGLVGAMNNSTIKNSYSQGDITSSQDGVGGITGSGENGSKIENCISKITFKTTSGPGYNGGIIGHSMNVVVENTISFSTGEKANRVHGTGLNGNSKNNYELKESTLQSNESGERVKVISESEINKTFYKEKLKLDENIWNLSNITNEVPALKNSDPNLDSNKGEEPKTSNVNIPDYERLHKLSNYDEQKEIAYNNLYKLMPFYDSKYLLVEGKDIKKDSILNTKRIKAILPLTTDGEYVTVLTNKTQNIIKKVKVVWEDDTKTEYIANYKNVKSNVANYELSGLNVSYQYDKYIIKEDADLVSNLVDYAQKIDYTNDLDPLTEEDDSRLYRDYYNETTKNNIKQIVLKVLENIPEYTIWEDNEVFSKYVQEKLQDEKILNNILYGYNYIDRWYNFNMGATKVSDMILFNDGLFDKKMNIINVSNDVLTGNRNTNSTQTFYANSLSKYTSKGNIGDFLDYMILTLTSYTDVNDWLTENYQGIIYEIPVEGHTDVKYRGWANLKVRNNFLLPFLTLPKNSAYMVSSATQFLVGAQRTYISNPDDETQHAELMKKIEDYAAKIRSFYQTASGFVPSERLNAVTDIQIDHRFTKNSEGKSEYQSAGTTEEPFHKNFNEAVGFWAAANGSAAYATGVNVFWNAYSALSDFYAWSHESGHNQDSRVFLLNSGRRPQGWAEDYADGNTSQGFGDGAMNFNLSYTYSMDESVTTNLTPERINSTEKIESYYKEMFEASDFLDYIEAKAFLTLTPEEQSKVAVQVYYPNKGDDEQDTGDETTGWRVLTKEDFEKMNLKTIEDLWDNHITIKPGITDTTSLGTGKYGAESIYTRYWYQPHNDNGRPDSYTLKHLAWEMLGIGGYEGGYVTYYSGRSKTDLDAIRKVTGDDTMTWKRYKMERYQLMESKWNSMSYIDADDVLEQYKEALKSDAEKSDRNVTSSTSVKRMNYHYLKRITNDFETDIFGNTENIVHIKSAQELKTKITTKPNGVYVLDNDIDVSSLTGTNALIDVTFMGKLDGQGHKITGATMPLFNSVKFSYISNLSIENFDITTTGRAGAIARTVDMANIQNVNGKNISLTSNDKENGGLFGLIERSILKNVHVTDVTVNGSGRTGVIAGYANQCSRIENCSSNGTVSGDGNAVGAFMGQIDNSTAINCYSTGSISGRLDVGGFTGWAENSLIENCFNAATVIPKSSNQIGGFIGQVRSGTVIRNNISLGDTTAYKFDGRTASDLFGTNYSNNFEYEGATGVSTLTRSGIDFSGKISVASSDQVKSSDFYTDVLGWSNLVWDFSDVSSGGLPKLK